MIGVLWFLLVVSDPVTHVARADYVFSENKDCAAAAKKIKESTRLKAKCEPIAYTPTKAQM